LISYRGCFVSLDFHPAQIYITVKRFRLLQPYFGHLSIPFAYVTHKVQVVLIMESV